MAMEAAPNWTLPPGNTSKATCAVNMAFAHRYLPAVYLVVIPLGLVGNALGLWQLRARPRRSALGLLVGSLGLADLLYVSTLPFLVSYYAQGRRWVFGTLWCHLTRSFFHLNLYASIGFLTCISVHRYLGIVHPMKARGRCQALASSLWLSAVVWVWVIVQVAPDFTFNKMDAAEAKCHDTTDDKSLDTYLPYTAAVTAIGFVIPFLIIIGCYGHVVVVLCRNNTVDADLRRRSIRLVVVVTVLFALCFLPYHIFRNLNLLSRHWQRKGTCTQASRNIYVSYQVTRGLASLNSALNPLLYVMTSEDSASLARSLRQRAGRSLRCLFCSDGSQHSDERKFNFTLCEQQVSEEL